MTFNYRTVALYSFFVPFLSIPCLATSVLAQEIDAKQVTSQENLIDEPLNTHDIDILEIQAKLKTKEFATRLKSALMMAVKQGGLEQGVNVCAQQAPKIANALSTDGWTVSRTSLKTRNVNNAPSVSQRQTLIDFDSAYKNAQGKLTKSEIVDNQYRFMKAIPTSDMCLGCHGQNVNPELKKVIKSHYPNDMATGFTTEDIRGAFVLIKNLDSEN